MPKDFEESKVYQLYSRLIDLQEGKYKYFQGKLFTIIDAVTSDEEKKKAIKDLLRELLHDWSQGQAEIYKDLCKSLARDLKDEKALEYLVPEVSGEIGFPKIV